MLKRLTDLPLDTDASVVAIESAFAPRMSRLAALGVVPGSLIRVVARRPAVLFESGGTMLAVEEEIAREIYVDL